MIRPLLSIEESSARAAAGHQRSGGGRSDLGPRQQHGEMDDGFKSPLQVLWCIFLGCEDFNFLPTNGFFIQPPKVKLLAGEQKATEG